MRGSLIALGAFLILFAVCMAGCYGFVALVAWDGGWIADAHAIARFQFLVVAVIVSAMMSFAVLASIGRG